MLMFFSNYLQILDILHERQILLLFNLRLKFFNIFSNRLLNEFLHFCNNFNSIQNLMYSLNYRRGLN